MTSRRYPTFEKQWQKLMFSFFDYIPTRVKSVSQKDWNVRRLIWNFKDGKNSFEVANLIATKIKKMYGDKATEIVFACIPASSDVKNEKRYKMFSDIVCRLTGAENAFSHIHVEGERLAIHESNFKKSVNNVEVINFDSDFFNGKSVLIFDDIITKGFSYAKFANQLEHFGANVLGGLFLGKTAVV